MALNKDPKSGKWRASIGSNSSGTRKEKSFHSRQDAEKWVAHQEKLRAEQEITSTISEMPMDEALERFLGSKRKDRSSKYLAQLRSD